MTTNPNGANGTTSDPREQTCWDNYVESITHNRENAYQAALDAGYEESSAINITVRRWFIERKEGLQRKEMLSKAERNLGKVLDMDEENSKAIPALLKIKTDVSTTIVKTLGKNKGYSERTELTGADGKDLPVPILQGVLTETKNED